jgi:hypothetical protein
MVSRTAASESRATRCTSSISARAWAGSSSMTRLASSLLRAMTDRLWPSVSCKSRAILARSSLTARRASSVRAANSARFVRRTAIALYTVKPITDTDSPCTRAPARSLFVASMARLAVTPDAMISATATRPDQIVLAAVDA